MGSWGTRVNDGYVALPEELTPINLKAYLSKAIGFCCCWEVDKVHATLLRLLEWHDAKDRPHYDTLYGDTGVYYLLAGVIENQFLSEYGTSIRCPWLTDDGSRLLEALRTISAAELHDATGEAYDGVYY